MKRIAVIGVLGLGISFSVQAESFQCNFDSDYAFTQQGRTLIFTRASAPGKRIMIQDGRMVVDDKELVLDAGDKQNLAKFENEMRLLIPQVRQVTSEAVDIAFTALIEVSRGFNGEHNNSTLKKLQEAQISLQHSLGKNPALFINEDIGKKIIEPIVMDFIPDVAAAAVKQALSLAFSGDEKKAKEFEKRMDKMGKEIQTKVEARAKKLEPMAHAMCQRMHYMDKIEDSISVRLSNKEKINLLDTKAP